MADWSLNPGTTQSLVIDRFELSEGYADKTFNTALTYLGEFEDVTVDFNWTPDETVGIPLPSGLSTLSAEAPTSPTINEISVDTIDFSAVAPTFSNYDITTLDVPEFAVTMPDFFIPAPPSTTVPIFNYDAPVGMDINIPSANNIPDLPPLPKLTEILLPDELTFEMPEFAAIMPVDDLTPPDLVYSWNEAQYSSELSTALEIKIIDGILNGGVGMEPEIEQAIYDRARTRLDVEVQESTLLVKSEFSSMGSRLPQGAMIAALASARLKQQFSRDDLNHSIMIKSADLAYQYSLAIIDKGLNLEHEFMALFNSTQQRAFEASKLLIDFAIQEYDIRVKAFAARLDAYKTEAEIFKARISAEIARAELYKMIIDGRKLSVEMQGLMVDLYGKQLGAIETMSRIYAVKMEGAKTQSEINAQQVEKFKALIEAYKAQVGGVTAEYNLYQAQIVGESEKAKMYSYQVDGYKSVVDAFKARSDIDVSLMRAEIEKTQGEINVFTAMLDKYKTDIQAKSTEAEIQAKAEGLKIQAFDSEIKKFTSVVSAMTESYKAESSVAIANTDANLRYGEILSKLESAQAEIEAELIKAKATISSQLASAALSSVSAGASLGFSESDGKSENWSNSVSASTTQSLSDSKSESHIYAEKCCGE